MLRNLGFILALGAPDIDAPDDKDLRPSTLAWTAPDGCLDAERVEARISELLGAPLSSPREESIEATGVVRERNGAWILELTIASTTGRRVRTLEAATCAELAETAALLVAITVDPTVDVGSFVAEPAPAPEPETKKEPEPEATPEPTPAPVPEPDELVDPPEPSVRGFVRVLGGVAVGPLPSVAPGVAGSLGVRGRLWRVEALGSYWIARSSASGDVTSRIDHWFVVARGCFVPTASNFEFPLCVGPELGMMRGRTDNADRNGSGALLWAAGHGSVGFVYVANRWVGIGLEADVTVPISRPGFSVDGLGLVHRAAPAGFYGLAGVEIRFP